MNAEKKMKLVLAPMAGVTNRAYRRLIKEINSTAVDHIFTEMINATGVSRLDNGTLNLLPSKEEVCIVQIYGNNSLDFAKAAEYILSNYENVSGIDINAACPVKKVVRNGSGSALLHDLKKLEQIIIELKKVLSGSVKSLSVKIRKGWEGYENYHEVIEMCDNLGVDFVSIHGRTVEQMYNGCADFSILDSISSNHCEIFWTGDMFDLESVKRICNFRNTISGILFARGTYGNPWIINQANDFLNGQIIQKIRLEEKIKTISRHVELLLDDYSSVKVTGQLKRFVAGYTKGIRDARQQRNAILRMDDLDGMVDLLITTISADYEDDEDILVTSKINW
ncbi:MAG TPA: tRNA-dihydrouridine synthase [Thermotogota bacterium]|nr:tRNA-dihydrouridine synthase [Thermotogota bacterium]